MSDPERTGTLGLYEKIGGHGGSKEGAGIAPTDILDPCTALLFLRRGTVPVGDVMTPRVEPKRAP